MVLKAEHETRVTAFSLRDKLVFTLKRRVNKEGEAERTSTANPEKVMILGEERASDRQQEGKKCSVQTQGSWRTHTVRA